MSLTTCLACFVLSLSLSLHLAASTKGFLLSSAFLARARVVTSTITATAATLVRGSVLCAAHSHWLVSLLIIIITMMAISGCQARARERESLLADGADKLIKARLLAVVTVSACLVWEASNEVREVAHRRVGSFGWKTNKPLAHSFVPFVAGGSVPFVSPE